MAENSIANAAHLGRKLLSLAAANTPVSDVERAIAGGAALDETDRRGRTPLHLAVEGNRVGIGTRSLTFSSIIHSLHCPGSGLSDTWPIRGGPSSLLC
jgi:hypothetical protein